MNSYSKEPADPRRPIRPAKLSTLMRRLYLAFAVGLLPGLAQWGHATTLSVTNGLAMRLEATSGVTTDANGLVSYWSDQSTNGHDAFQSTPAEQPLLVTNGTVSGAPVVRMDGLSSLLTVTGQVLTSQDFTIFAVVNAAPADAGNHEIFGNWSGADGNYETSLYLGITAFDSPSDSARVRFTDGDASAGTAIDLADDFILEAINQTTTNGGLPMASVAQDGITLSVTGPLATRVLASEPTYGPYTIGVQGDPDHGFTAGEYWPGDIAALLVYNRALTSAERSQVREYLQNQFLEPSAPRLAAIVPATNTVISSFTSVTLIFSEPVTNVALANLLINGSAIATNLAVVSSREYVFQFPQPPNGECTVGFATNSAITDLSSPPNAFARLQWSYNLAGTPKLAASEPAAGMDVSTLNSIILFFNVPVTNVTAADLLIDGAASATNVVVLSPTQYMFFFPQPALGAVTIAFAANQGIVSLVGLPFGGGSWTYTLDPNAPVSLIVQNGLAMRLEATSGVTTDASGLVSLWSDQSGNGHDAFQSTPSEQPSLVAKGTPSGAPVVRMDGQNSLLTVTGQVLTSQDFTIFAVVNATPSDTGNHEIFGNWSWNNLFTSVYLGITGFGSSSDSATVRFTDADNPAGTAVGLANDFILEAITQHDPSGGAGISKVAQDGVSLYAARSLSTRELTSNPSTSPYTIGIQGDPDHGGSAGEHWPGDIAALLVYDRALAPPEISQVRQYLNAAYLYSAAAPQLTDVTPATNTAISTFTSVTLTFSKAVTNVNMADLLVNGKPIATNLVVVSAQEYLFQFPQPADGECVIGFAANSGVTDLASPPNAFVTTALQWNYILLSATAPGLAATAPAAGMHVSTLNSIALFFDVPVANVTAGDLLVNGAPIATNVVAFSSTQYMFFFPQPALGAVHVAFASNQGIVSLVGVPFGGGSWSYTLDPNAPASLIVQSGLAIRLEAGSGVTTDANGLVSSWSDQSTNGHDAFQSTPGEQPRIVTNATPSGAPVVRMDGQSNLLTVAGQVITSQDFTIFAVVNATPTDAGNHEIFGNWSWNNTGSSIYLGITGFDNLSNSATVRFTDADNPAGTAVGLAHDFILEAITQTDPGGGPGVAEVVQNGVVLYTQPALSGRVLTCDPSTGPYTIGVQGDPDHGGSAGENWPGDIAALLVYNRALTTPEIAQVQQYLGATYLLATPSVQLAAGLAAGNQISISWPQAGSAGFTLQSTTNLSAGTWTNSGPATLVGGEYKFNEPLSGFSGCKFYRLVKH